MPPLTLPLIMRLRTQSRDAVSGNLELEDFGNILLESGDAAVKLEPGDSIYSMPKWGGRHISTNNNALYVLGEVYFLDNILYVQVPAETQGLSTFKVRRLGLNSTSGGFVSAIITSDAISNNTAATPHTTKTIVSNQYVYGIQTRLYTSTSTASSYIRRYFKTLFSTNVPTDFQFGRTLQFTNQAVYDAVEVADGVLVICGSLFVSPNFRQYIGVSTLSPTSINLRVGTISSNVYDYTYRSLAYDPTTSSIFYGGGVVAGAEFGRLTLSGTTLSHEWRYRYFGQGTTKVLFAGGYLYTATIFSTGYGVSAIFELGKFTIAGALIWRKRISGAVDNVFAEFYSDVNWFGITYHSMGRLVFWTRSFINSRSGAYVAAFTEDGDLIWERGVYYANPVFIGAPIDVVVDPTDGALVVGIVDGSITSVFRMSYDGTPLRFPGGLDFYITNAPAVHSTGSINLSLQTPLSADTGSVNIVPNDLTISSDNGAGSYTFTSF